MDFISNQSPQIQEMLAAIGLKSMDELFQSIPSQLKLKAPQQDDGLSEYEGIKWMEQLAAKNSYSLCDSYLGGGAYEHHIPALVGAICSKSEFLTSYTPYQPEASQGMLQAIFEFQSVICALTGMEVANASAYDAASACAEALLMALRFHKERKKVWIASSLNPHYQAVIKTYLSGLPYEFNFLPSTPEGALDLDGCQKLLDSTCAAVLVQNPNYFGVLDQVKACFSLAKNHDITTILCADLLAYGLCPSAKELGADIALGDCQSLGLALNYGGPYAGYIACTSSLMRQLPGRIVGETVDTQGRRGFVLTLQAREQHIRREKATSNICTNQALAALAALITLLWYGKEGMRKLALTNYQRAHYLKARLSSLPGVFIQNSYPTFNEFLVAYKQPFDQLQAHFLARNIVPGIPLKGQSALLVAVTETKSRVQLDNYVKAWSEL